jgi:hypothetical protein
MPSVRVAYMRLDTLGREAILQIQVESPVTELLASLFAHDTVAVSWSAGLQLRPTENRLVWATKWKLVADLPSLVEVGDVTVGPTMLGSSPTGPVRWVFLKPDGGDGTWMSDERAQAERERLEGLRKQHFTGPLVAPDAAQDAPEFYVLAIADNLLLTQEQSVPGLILSPMTSVLGDDIRVVLNENLVQRGFRQALMPDKWIEQMRRDRPAVLIECRVKAETAEAARTFSSEVIKGMLALMTLLRGAAARLIGGVVGEQAAAGHYDVRGIWIEHSGYTGNLMGGIISGEDVHGLQRLWSDLQANPRAQLWASLYADAVRDPRWDYQFFRCFSLLETIADSVVWPNVVVTDAAGNRRQLPSGNGYYTTSKQPGKTYALLMHLATIIPQSPISFTTQRPSTNVAAADQLWDEVMIWRELRNDVAHEGAWQLPHPGETPEHAAAHNAIASRGHDGTFESGAAVVVRKAQDVVKSALFAAINGTL